MGIERASKITHVGITAKYFERTVITAAVENDYLGKARKSIKRSLNIGRLIVSEDQNADLFEEAHMERGSRLH